MKPPINLQTDCWLNNSIAARIAYHRRQARITIAIAVLSVALAVVVGVEGCKHFTEQPTSEQKN